MSHSEIQKLSLYLSSHSEKLYLMIPITKVEIKVCLTEFVYLSGYVAIITAVFVELVNV